MINTKGYKQIEEYGAFFIVQDGELLEVAMNEDGSPDTYDGELNVGIVSAPESQEFLDVINSEFGTDFKLDQFAGR